MRKSDGEEKGEVYIITPGYSGSQKGCKGGKGEERKVSWQTTTITKRGGVNNVLQLSIVNPTTFDPWRAPWMLHSDLHPAVRGISWARTQQGYEIMAT